MTTQDMIYYLPSVSIDHQPLSRVSQPHGCLRPLPTNEQVHCLRVCGHSPLGTDNLQKLAKNHTVCGRKICRVGALAVPGEVVDIHIT